MNSVPTQGVYPVEQIRMHLSGVRALLLPSPLLFRALGGTGQAVSFCGPPSSRGCPSSTVLVFSQGSEGQRHLRWF